MGDKDRLTLLLPATEHTRKETTHETTHAAIVSALSRQPAFIAQPKPGDTPATTLSDKEPLEAKKVLEIEQERQPTSPSEDERVPHRPKS